MRRKRHRTEDVKLNLAAMLDMAFQLLAFFIFTFRPAPVEGQLALRMPPPMPVTQVRNGQSAGNDASNTNPLQGLNSLVITAMSNADGELKQMAIGESPVGTTKALERRLAAVLAEPGTAFDQVIVQVDSRLMYENLMQVIDVCSRQKLANGEPLTKLSFVELPAK
jgi:biopolymer transport protein ExbD